MFGLGLLIPSVIGSVGLFLAGMHLRLWWRVAAACLFALLAACGGVLAIDTILGALTGASGALIGIGFLGALSFVLFVAAFQAVVGLPGTAMAAIGFIFVGNAVSGGSVPVGFLPGGFRQIAPWLPNNAIVRGVRDVVYFNGHDLGHPLLVSLLWPAAGVGILVAVDLLHLSERRRAPNRAHEIHRTPALVHLHRRLARSAGPRAPGKHAISPAATDHPRGARAARGRPRVAWAARGWPGGGPGVARGSEQLTRVRYGRDRSRTEAVCLRTNGGVMSTSEITTISASIHPQRPATAARCRRSELLGRHAERAALDRLLDRARGGHGAALVVRGEPGIGKSALLEYAADRASGCRLARSRGVEAESGLQFAGVQRLVGRIAVDRADRLPAPQRDALHGVFGLRQTSAPDWFLVGLAVANLLSEMGTQRPVLCLVDDLQWLDVESARVLAFVARRIAGERVAIVFTVREPSQDLDLDELPDLVVEGLGHHDARRLLATLVPGGLDEQVRDRIVAEARGNPRALLDLVRDSTPAELAGGFGLPDATGRSSFRHEREAERRVRALPEDTRRLLLIAAADAVGDVTVVMRAAEHLGLGPETVASAESDGLVEFGARVQFRHPLMRSATYRSAGPDDRRRAHAALALASDPAANSDRQAWHRAHAAAGPEESVAADLERSVSRARARGGAAAAAAFLERAAELTPVPGKRGIRALAAASAKFDAGDVDAAETLLAAAGLYPPSDSGPAGRQRLLARIALARTQGDTTLALVSATATHLESLDPRLARETHLDALWAIARTGRFETAPGSVEAAAAALASADPGDARCIDRLLEAMVLRLRHGYGAALAATSTAVAAVRDKTHCEASHEDEVRWCWLACQLAAEVFDEDAFVEIIRGPGEIARARGELSTLPLTLNQFALHRLFVGDLAGAGRRIDEAADIAAATRNPSSVPGLSVLVAAWRGDREATMALRTRAIAETTAAADGVSIQVAEYATAVLQSGLGEYDDAAASAARALEFDGLGFTPWVLPELIEAAARSGDRGSAELAFARLAERTRQCDTDWARGIEARSLALLTEGSAAEELYRQALEHFSQSGITVNHARATLLYGEWLRRENRRVDARVQLRAALEAFETMGAAAFADRARRELLATGETVRKRGDDTRDELTPQEAHIARLAGEGRTNPEIAAQLYLSPRTVEWHLRKVFTKLDIKGRRQLSHAVLDRAALAGTDR